MEIAVGAVTLAITDHVVPIEGEAVNGGRQSGLAVACELSTPDGGILEVALTSWEHGDRDVRCFKRLAGPIMYDRLVHGARLGVASKRDGQWDTELGILRFHDDRQPTVVKAAWEDLDTVLNADARQFLLDHGASGVGTKDALIGDTGKRRSYLMMVSAVDDPAPPIVAYTLTRVLPLLTGFGSSAAIPVGLA
jgi:hypothetical protein